MKIKISNITQNKSFTIDSETVYAIQPRSLGYDDSPRLATIILRSDYLLITFWDMPSFLIDSDQTAIWAYGASEQEQRLMQDDIAKGYKQVYPVPVIQTLEMVTCA